MNSRFVCNRELISLLIALVNKIIWIESQAIYSVKILSTFESKVDFISEKTLCN
jgi:hypothetical protein